MKKMVRGAIAILALSGLSGCVDDPLLDLNGDPTEVRANPIVLNVKEGDSSAVLLRLINKLNNGVRTSFTISGAGAGIAVHYDPLYRPEFLDGSDTLVVPVDKNQQRYFIVGVTPGEYTYTASAGGLSGTFKVRVEPKNLGAAALNKTTAAVGETVVITSPPNTKFTQTATVTFAGGPSAIASRSADGKTISVLVGPNINGPATVVGVTMDYLPAAGNLTLASGNSLVTPVLTSAPTTVSTATPAFGGSVVVTLGGGLQFTPTSTVTIGGTAAYVTARAGDGSSMTVVPVGTPATTAVGFTNIIYGVLPTVNLSVPSDKTIAVGAPTSDANAGSIVTAPTFTLPAVGSLGVISGGGAFTSGGPCSLAAIGGNRCTYYKVTLAAPLKVDAALTWQAVSADLGVYLVNDLGTVGTLIADGFGAQTGGTESSAAAGFTIPAGTSYIAVVHYGAIGTLPTWFQLRLTGRN